MARTRRPPELVELSDGSRAVSVTVTLNHYTSDPIPGLLVVEQGTPKSLLVLLHDEWIAINPSDIASVRPTNP